jgi:hypothetical protein
VAFPVWRVEIRWVFDFCQKHEDRGSWSKKIVSDWNIVFGGTVTVRGTVAVFKLDPLDDL